MSELSVFTGESGDFGPVPNHNDYYIVSFVIHEQDNDISEEVKNFLDGTRKSWTQTEITKNQAFQQFYQQKGGRLMKLSNHALNSRNHSLIL